MTATAFELLGSALFGLAMTTATAMALTPEPSRLRFVRKAIRRMTDATHRVLPHSWGLWTASQPMPVEPAHSQPAENLVLVAMDRTIIRRR